jgi:hypothetical protein
LTEEDAGKLERLIQKAIIDIPEVLCILFMHLSLKQIFSDCLFHFQEKAKYKPMCLKPMMITAETMVQEEDHKKFKLKETSKRNAEKEVFRDHPHSLVERERIVTDASDITLNQQSNNVMEKMLPFKVGIIESGSISSASESQEGSSVSNFRASTTTFKISRLKIKGPVRPIKIAVTEAEDAQTQDSQDQCLKPKSDSSRVESTRTTSNGHSYPSTAIHESTDNDKSVTDEIREERTGGWHLLSGNDSEIREMNVRRGSVKHEEESSGRCKDLLNNNNDAIGKISFFPCDGNSATVLEDDSCCQNGSTPSHDHVTASEYLCKDVFLDSLLEEGELREDTETGQNLRGCENVLLKNEAGRKFSPKSGVSVGLDYWVSERLHSSNTSSGKYHATELSDHEEIKFRRDIKYKESPGYTGLSTHDSCPGSENNGESLSSSVTDASVHCHRDNRREFYAEFHAHRKAKVHNHDHKKMFHPGGQSIVKSRLAPRSGPSFKPKPSLHRSHLHRSYSEVDDNIYSQDSYYGNRSHKHGHGSKVRMKSVDIMRKNQG